MTEEQFIEKWATYLSGKFSRFAFCQVDGSPGLPDRVRGMVADIESAVRRMLDEAGKVKHAVPPNGPAAQPARKA